jgi:hypothetical protein
LFALFYFSIEAKDLKGKKLSAKILITIGLISLFLGLGLIGMTVYANIQPFGVPLGVFSSQDGRYTVIFTPTQATLAINQSVTFTTSFGSAIDTTAHEITYSWFVDQNQIPVTSSSCFLFFENPGIHQVKVEITIDGIQINCVSSLTVTNLDGSLPSVSNPTPTPVATTALNPTYSLEAGSVLSIFGVVSILVSRKV